MRSLLRTGGARYLLSLALLSLALLACDSEDSGNAGSGQQQAGTGAAAGSSGAMAGASSNAGTGATAGSGASAGTSSGSGSGMQAGQGSAGTAPSGMMGGGQGDRGGGAVQDDADGGMDPDAGNGGGDAGAPMTDAGGEPPRGPIAIDPPVADDCITDVSAGDHTFSCGGVSFQVMVDEHCTEFACGLIFDVHGASMSGEAMRQLTRLHELGAEAGYLVVHPTASTGTWSWDSDAPAVADFMDRMIAAFHVDERRVHMTGFSMGSAMTFWFLCNHADKLASVGPVTGASADQVDDEATGEPCIPSIDADWQPRVPILFMSGTMDNALSIDAATARTDGIVSRLGLSGGDEIDSGSGWRRRRWQDGEGMVFDFLTHDYAGGLAGHCIPGELNQTDLIASFTSCGTDKLHWGRTVLQWFIDHPKP